MPFAVWAAPLPTDAQQEAPPHAAQAQEAVPLVADAVPDAEQLADPQLAQALVAVAQPPALGLGP